MHYTIWVQQKQQNGQRETGFLSWDGELVSLARDAARFKFEDVGEQLSSLLPAVEAVHIESAPEIDDEIINDALGKFMRYKAQGKKDEAAIALQHIAHELGWSRAALEQTYTDGLDSLITLINTVVEASKE